MSLDSSDHDVDQDLDDGLLSGGDDRAAIWDRRQVRNLELQDSALAKEDCFEANIEVQAGGLLEISTLLEEMVRNKLISMNGQIDGIENVTPALDSYLRVSRQAERYANLKMRITQQREPLRGGQKAAVHGFSLEDARKQVGFPTAPR